MERLTPDEVADLGRRAREGDVAARNRIVEAHSDLADEVARHCCRRLRGTFPVDDMRQEGHVALLHAASRWPGAGPFRDYAARTMYRWVLSRARRWRTLPSLDEPGELGDAPAASVADGSAVDALDALIQDEAFDLMTRELQPAQRRVAWVRLVAGASREDSAAILGMDEPGLRRVELAAIDRLRTIHGTAGCAPRPGRPFEDLSGQDFGRLHVEGVSERRYANGKRLWVCRCACGRYTEVLASALQANRRPGGRGTRSCGCLKAEENRRRWGRTVSTTGEEIR